MKKNRIISAVSALAIVSSGATALTAGAEYHTYFGVDCQKMLESYNCKIDELNSNENYTECPQTLRELFIRNNHVQNAYAKSGQLTGGEIEHMWFSEQERISSNHNDIQLDESVLVSSVIADYELYDYMDIIFSTPFENEEQLSELINNNFEEYKQNFDIAYITSQYIDRGEEKSECKGFEIVFKSPEHQFNYDIAESIYSFFNGEYAIKEAGIQFDGRGNEHKLFYWSEPLNISVNSIEGINTALTDNNLPAQLSANQDKIRLDYSENITVDGRNAVIDFLFNNYDVEFGTRTYYTETTGTCIDLTTTQTVTDNFHEINILQKSVLQDMSTTLMGDSNCDGDVNIADAVLVQQFIVNPDKYTLSEQGKLNADVFNTGDGVTMSDALEIQLMIANN